MRWQRQNWHLARKERPESWCRRRRSIAISLGRQKIGGADFETFAVVDFLQARKKVRALGRFRRLHRYQACDGALSLGDVNLFAGGEHVFDGGEVVAQIADGSFLHVMHFSITTRCKSIDCACRDSREADVQQGEPILDGLQPEAEEDEGDAEDAKAALGEIIGVELDVGSDSDADAGDESGDQADANGEKPSVLDVANEGAAKKRRDDVAESAADGSPEETPREARAALGGVVGGGSQTAGVDDDLAEGDEDSESESEAQAEGRVESGGEAGSANGAEERFPREGIVREAAGGAVELDGQGEAAGEAGGDSEEKAEAQAVTDAENNGVSDGAGEDAERAVLSAEKIVSEVEAAENVERSAGDADGGDEVMVDVVIHVGADYAARRKN